MTRRPDTMTDAPEERPRTLRERLSMPAWSLYDFSDTIFSASMLTLFFPLWVAGDLKSEGGSDAVFAFALSLSALSVAITAPVMGTVSDRLNRRVPLLAVCVVSCASATAMIGMFGGLGTGLALFFIANFLYQTGLIFYNSLIVNVSTERNRGVVSGIGIGLGYVGLFVAFLVMRPIVAAQGNQSAFVPTALMYVLFATPLLLIVKEGGLRHRLDMALVKESYTQLYRTFRRAREHTNLFRFIIARFIYTEAVNTVASFYVIYLVSIGVFTNEEALDLITRVLLLTFAAAVVVGFMVSRFGAKRVLLVGVAGWATFVAAGVIAGTQSQFWAIAILGGCFWASPQIADRVLLTRLAPEGQLGEFFGLFQMSGRLSSVIGPLLWGLTTTVLLNLGELRFRIAMGMVAVFLILGFLVLLWVREQREESDLADAGEAAPNPKVVD